MLRCTKGAIIYGHVIEYNSFIHRNYRFDTEPFFNIFRAFSI